MVDYDAKYVQLVSGQPNLMNEAIFLSNAE